MDSLTLFFVVNRKNFFHITSASSCFLLCSPELKIPTIRNTEGGKNYFKFICFCCFQSTQKIDRNLWLLLFCYQALNSEAKVITIEIQKHNGAKFSGEGIISENSQTNFFYLLLILWLECFNFKEQQIMNLPSHWNISWTYNALKIISQETPREEKKLKQKMSWDDLGNKRRMKSFLKEMFLCSSFPDH